MEVHISVSGSMVVTLDSVRIKAVVPQFGDHAMAKSRIGPKKSAFFWSLPLPFFSTNQLLKISVSTRFFLHSFRIVELFDAAIIVVTVLVVAIAIADVCNGASSIDTVV